MTATPESTDFSDKWRAFWPEWRIGAVFVPAGRRDAVAAWFALLHECTTAAWGGEDSTPGLAKLAWWNEELRGWAKGAKRHPLAVTLQCLSADWARLATSLQSLQATRERPVTGSVQASGLDDFAAAVGAAETQLFDDTTVRPGNGVTHQASPGDAAVIAEGVTRDLLAERVLLHRDRAVASAMLDVAQPEQHRDTRPRLLQSAYLRARLRTLVASGSIEPASAWHTLGLSWRAARGR